jgi:hypothetical protein
LELLHLLERTFDQLGQPTKQVAVLKQIASVHDRNGLLADRDEILQRILRIDEKDQSAQQTLSEGRTMAQEKMPFEELSFDEFDSVTPRREPTVTTAHALAASQTQNTPSPASFADLEALAEVVAAEPVSRPDISVAAATPEPVQEETEVLSSTRPEMLVPTLPPPLPDQADEVSGILEPIDLDDLEGPVNAPLADTRDAAALGTETDESAEMPEALSGELQEFDFYVRNGLMEAAENVLQDVAEEYRSHPQVIRRQEMLKP